MTPGRAHVFCPHGKMDFPRNKLFTRGERLFNPPKREHVLKRDESHRCEVNTRFLRFLEGTHFGKSLTEYERND